MNEHPHECLYKQAFSHFDYWMREIIVKPRVWPAVIIVGQADRPKRSYITLGTVIETPGWAARR